jgi:hypothetical protein
MACIGTALPFTFFGLRSVGYAFVLLAPETSDVGETHSMVATVNILFHIVLKPVDFNSQMGNKFIRPVYEFEM